MKKIWIILIVLVAVFVAGFFYIVASPYRFFHIRDILTLQQNSKIKNYIQDIKSRDLAACRYAKGALYKVGKPAIPLLIEALKNEDSWVRNCVSDVLGQIGDTSAAPVLIEMLKDKDKGVRISAAYSLGAIKDNSALKVLKYVAKNDKEKDVRNIAKETIKEINDKKNK